MTSIQQSNSLLLLVSLLLGFQVIALVLKLLAMLSLLLAMSIRVTSSLCKQRIAPNDDDYDDNDDDDNDDDYDTR